MALGLEIGACQLQSQVVLVVNYSELLGMTQKHVHTHNLISFFIFQHVFVSFLLETVIFLGR